MEIYRGIVLNRAAYEQHFPYVNVIKAEDAWWVVPEKYNPSEYLQHYITRQKSLEAIEAFFEGVVKGICKPKIMFE